VGIINDEFYTEGPKLVGIMICRWTDATSGRDIVAWHDLDSPQYTPHHALSAFLCGGVQMEILETCHHTLDYYDARTRCAYWREILKEQTHGMLHSLWRHVPTTPSGAGI